MTIFDGATKPSAGYHDWDPRIPEVVRCLKSDLSCGPAGVTMEHVGSTAVVGCGGKGIIDLLALYPEGVLEDTKAWLLALGLARQGPEFSRAWPESRPMYLGRYHYMGEPFLVYVHVVASSSDEVRRFREFRELLRATPGLVAEYCRAKREILAAGVTDTDEYAAQKRPFMRQALGASHAIRDDDA
jgi:GrpB-like predicted nucleotidyltransferase (UPF0157 family)